MRVEPRKHPVDRFLDQLGIVGFLDIVSAHALQNFAEQVELAIDFGICGDSRVGPRQIQNRVASDDAGDHEENPHDDLGLAHSH